MGRKSVAVVSSPPLPTTTVPGTASAATALAPGFRFHPTDEELVSYYLKRKVLNKPVRFDAIGEVDIYKHEPWELAVYSRLKTRDQEWYFFSALDKKYGNGARMNRATNKGYWKATGKDREIRRDIQLIGMKKTLVFHSGRAPDGLRTNWVMHEYRLVEDETERNGGLQQDAYVLCRVFHKNNIGPPSGNRYAPFLEEEWADGGGALIPGINVKVMADQMPITANSSEIQSSKDLININEPPKENQMEIEAVKPQDDDDDNDGDDDDNDGDGDDDDGLKREHTEDDCPPPSLCILNKEAPLPLLQYKRRRQNESNASSRITQDHCSSTTTTLISSSSAATTAANTAISALLEFSLMGITDKLQQEQQEQQEDKKKEDSVLVLPNPTHETKADPGESLMIPGNLSKVINDLQKEIHQMSVERESFKFEMMSAEAMISILQSRIDALRQENEELKKNVKG